MKVWLSAAMAYMTGEVMKKRISWLIAAGMILNLVSSYATAQAEKAGALTEEVKISVLNPRGTPPPIQITPLAPRLDTLDGKTVYLVDVRFMGGDIFLKEIAKWFAQNMPKVKIVFREKTGSYGVDDPELWAEIKAKGDAAIMAIGH